MATTLTARCPEDLLAVVPVVLGFVPTQSVVMLTFGAEQTFHARVDLPPGRHGIHEMVDALLEPARRHRVRRVVFVVYGADVRLARSCGRALDRAFATAGIDVVDMLRADGSRWFPLIGQRRGVPEWGVPYDVSAHPFVAEAVVDGKVTHASRDELAATLDPQPEHVAAVTDLVAELAPWSESAPPTAAELISEGTWAGQLVSRHTAAGSLPTEHEVARLLRGLQVRRIRDAAWSVLDRPSAPCHVGFWTGVVRVAPETLVAPPATLLGWAAWKAGHGALAWCAVDLCARVDPDYTAMTLLARFLEHAVPPTDGQTGFDWAEGLGPAG